MSPVKEVDGERERTGHVYLLLFYTATVWGLNVVVIKVLTDHFDVVFLSALRMVVAFLAIWVMTLLWIRAIPRVSGPNLVWLGTAAFLMVYAHQIGLALGLQWSTATNGALILALNPLLSVGLAAIFLRERLTPFRMLGVLLGLIGVTIVVLGASGADLRLTGIGDLVLIGAMLCYVAAGVCIRKVAHVVHPLAIGWYMYLFGSVMLLVHAALTPSFYDPDQWFQGFSAWGLVFFSGIFSTALGGVLWNYGIARVGLGRTTLFLNWLPVSGLMFALFFLGEPLRAAHLVGLACIVIGTYMGLRMEPVPNRALQTGR